MEDGLKLGKRHDTPNIQIDYQKETLTGFDSSTTYTINGETVTTAEDDTITIQEGWFGTSISIVKKGSEDISDSEAQSLVIPARPGAPAVTGDVNRIDGATAAMEYSTDRGVTWTVFIEETVANNLVRSRATDTAFASRPTAEITVTEPSSGSGGSSATRYPVTVEDTDNGSIRVSPTRAERGDTVTITVNPDDGYELDKLTVTDSNGDEISVRDRGNGKYTFIMPRGRVTVEATFAENVEEPEVLPFVDVPAGAYYYDVVAWAVENNVTDGTSSTTFSPNNACTRAQMVTFLWRAAGSPEPETTVNPFNDVSASAYYYKAVLWAAEQGITSGTSATTFSPDNACIRAQIVTFLWWYLV